METRAPEPRKGKTMMKLDEKMIKEMSFEELVDMFDGADIPLPPLAQEKPRCTITITVNGPYQPRVSVNIFDDEAETVWWYDLVTRRYAHSGYGPECCWTEEENIDKE